MFSICLLFYQEARLDWKIALKKKGFKTGGTLKFITSDGRVVRFRANRHTIKIYLKKNSMSEFSKSHITLPAINREGEYQLRWDDDIENYRFESTSDVPFIQNRTMTTSSFLMESDEIFLDYNQIRIVKNLSLKGGTDFEHRWPKNASFLIEGETGTGKTTLARKLHLNFVGVEAPFIALNLSAFNPALIESELFGHEKGSFTGAIKDKKGAVELAKGGTLFLDEIDSLDRAMQVKLLTFLDDLKYRRVGAEREQQTDCRVIFASGSSLKKRVRRGEFRADLMYRIQSGLIEKLTPLRESPECIVKELRRFSDEHSILIDHKLADFYEKCLWPGNYRQLHSHLKRKEMAHYSSRKLSLCPLDYELERKLVESSSRNSLEEIKKNHCHKVFLESQGNLSLAASRLEISKNTLRKIVA